MLSDPDWTVSELYSERGRPALPATSLIGPGAEVLVAVTKMSEEEIAARL